MISIELFVLKTLIALIKSFEIYIKIIMFDHNEYNNT